MRGFFTLYATVLYFIVVTAGGLNAQTPPCEVFTWIQCGDTLLNETTQGAGIDFNIVNSYTCLSQFGSGLHGPDKLYKINITQPTGLRFVLDILNGADLDMVVANTCGFVSNCQYSYEDNLATGIFREVLDVYLPDAGTYYLFVDGKDIAGFGNYNLMIDCDCDCMEPANDLPLGQAIFCDDFENYVANQVIEPQSSRWELWDSLAVDAVVTPAGFSGNGALIQTAGANKPRVLYELNDKEQLSGRYRLSWKMNVAAGKKARFNLMHRPPTFSTTNNWAYHVFFKTDGTGELRLANPANAPFATFNYPADSWLNVVNIVDMDKDSAELYINNAFVAKWKFSTGWTGIQNFNVNRMGAIEFVADDNTDFRIDEICVWKKTGNCSGGNGPVCVKNGITYPTVDAARCNLYTSAEWNLCTVTTVCDFGGTFINRSDNFLGTLDASDLAPSSLLTYQEVIDAYGGNPPQPLYADIYIFRQNSVFSSGISIGGGGDPDIRKIAFVCRSCPDAPPSPGTCSPEDCVQGEKLWSEFSGGDPLSNINSQNPCSKFYYIAVIGSLGSSYGINVVPPWNCPEPISNTLTCGTPASGSFTTNGNGGNGGYDSNLLGCYNGSRQYTYDDPKEYYKFVLDQPSEVTFQLTAQDPMGLFLFSFMCGENCLGYAENTTFDQNAILTATLSEGTYYLEVAKETDGGNMNYNLSANCEQYSSFVDAQTFVAGNFQSCPTDPTAQHQVGIVFNPTYVPSDYFNFYFRDSTNRLKGNLEASQYWHNSTQPLFFNLRADQTSDPEKCSYVTGDTFFVFIHQTENGRRTFKKFTPTFSPGSPAVFQPGTSSTITNLAEADVVNFGAETSFLRAKSGAVSMPLNFTTNENWAVERVNDPATWLNIDPEFSDGSETINLTFNENPSPLPRSVVLRFYSTDEPDLYRQFVQVQQQGQCLIPQPVNIITGATTVCVGTPVTLTADVGALYQDLYNYKWSTGETTPGITVSPGLGTTNYAVTVTNKYCFITSTNALDITVNPRPNAPTNPTGATMCAGQPGTPPVSVSPPGGNLQVFWYAEPSGAQPPLQPNPSNVYTPAPPPTATTAYYAETKNPVTGCVSATRTPAVLTVRPSPLITLNDTICAPSLDTYDIVVTVVDGGTLTTSPFFPVPPPNGNVYTISSIPKGANVTLTAANADCSSMLLVQSPVCACPVLNPPVSGGNKAYCPYEMPPALTVTVGAGETADWHDQLNGGMQLAAGTIAFTPNGPGTYYVNARNLTNDCVSARIPITLTLNPPPDFSVVSKTCAADLETYTLRFATNASLVLVSSPGHSYMPTTAGPGLVDVAGIHTGLPVDIHLVDAQTGCARDTTLEPHFCPCPAVNTPVSGGDKSYCPYEMPPALSVSVGANETADWYDQMSGGTLLEAGTTVFVPASPGIYYVNTRNPINDCVSDRIAITLTLNPLPDFSVISKTCSDDLKTYTVRIATSADDVSAAPFNVTNAGAGLFDIAGIQQGQPLSVHLFSSITTCERDTSLDAHFCFCPDLAKPTNPVNVTVCAGEPNIPPLQVSAGPGLSANWYFNGQLQAGSPALALNATVAGTYFAKTFNPVNLCESEDSTAATLAFKPLPTLEEGPKQCNPAWTQYQVTVTSNTTNFTSTPLVIPSNNGNGTFTFSGIPVATSVSITAIANGCTKTITVDPPVCSCTVLPLAPQNPNNPTICLGDNVPALSVTVTNPGAETVDWYDVPSGGIPVSTNALQYDPPLATATDTFYAQAKLILNPNCFSPRTPVILTVNLPAAANAGVNAAICAGDSLTLGGVIGGSANTGSWSAVPITGKFYPNASFLQAQQYIPPTGFAGGTITLTLTAFPAAPSVCPPATDQMVLTVQPLPVITLLSTDCELSLSTYSIHFSTSGDQIDFVPNVGTLNANPDQTYTYANVPEGQPVTITARFAGTGCDVAITPVAKECFCPTDIPKPGFVKNEEVCAGNSQFPALQVTAQAGTTVDWYDAASGGILLASNTLLFSPSAPGNYWAETRDLLSGCVSLQRQEVRLLEVPNPVADAGPDKWVCPGETTQLTGLQINDYTYLWNTGQTTSTIGVPAVNATYYLTVTSGICSATDSARVTVLPAVTAAVTPDIAIQCHGDNNGQLNATASGGTPPFSFAWSNGGSGQTTGNLIAGTYTVIVTDSAGCRAEVPFALTEPAAFVISIAPDSAIRCNGGNDGQLSATATGGTPPFTYTWSNGTTGQTNGNLAAGIYTVAALDSAGCLAENAFTLDAPAALYLMDTTIQNAMNGLNNGSILVDIGGGTPPYEYQWLKEDNSPIAGQTQTQLPAAAPGDYNLRVTDDNGCLFVAGPFTIKNIVPANEAEWASHIDVFPNPSTGKVYLRFDLPRRTDTEIEVFDMLGRQVLLAHPGVVQADVLEFDLSDLSAGLYVVKVNLGSATVIKTVSLHK